MRFCLIENAHNKVVQIKLIVKSIRTEHLRITHSLTKTNQIDLR